MRITLGVIVVPCNIPCRINTARNCQAEEASSTGAGRIKISHGAVQIPEEAVNEEVGVKIVARNFPCRIDGEGCGALEGTHHCPSSRGIEGCNSASGIPHEAMNHEI